jgi:hypothetical protein
MRFDDNGDEPQPVDGALEFDGPDVLCWHFEDRQQTLRVSEWDGVLYASIADDYQ